jgi:hypothetical protein
METLDEPADENVVIKDIWLYVIFAFLFEKERPPNDKTVLDVSSKNKIKK